MSPPKSLAQWDVSRQLLSPIIPKIWKTFNFDTFFFHIHNGQLFHHSQNSP
jgi:hypothetical protein